MQLFELLGVKVKLSSIFHPKQMGKQKSIKSWSNIYGAQPIIIKIIGQNFWP
jgi:hypothetical protein